MGDTSGAERHPFPSGAIFTSSVDAVIVMGADGRIRDWNPAAEEMFGHRREEAVGRELAELIIPGPLRDAHRNALHRHLQTGERTILDRRIEVTGLRRGGEEFPVELTVTRVEGAEPPLFAGFVRDLGELDRARRENARLQQRMAFLAQAGLELERSLVIDTTLRSLAHLTVPELAELTVIDLLQDDRSVRLTVAAAVSPEIARRVEEARRREPLSLDGEHPVVTVLREAEPVLIEEMSEEFHARIAQGPGHLELMRELGYRSAIVVPLIARNRILGALSLLRLSNPQPFDRDDLVLANDLARRAGLAIDNARLFESVRHLARTLQDSLLPRSMPEVPGLELAGRYRAAAQGQEVGGDFYDVFAIGDRHWGIAIGDVCGKGPEAAALTSLARYTIRALAGVDPGTVLQLLNDAVLRERETLPERFLTVAFAVARWDADGLVLDVASAGHPPPIVRRASGGMRRVGPTGPMVGIALDAEYRTERMVLEAGETVVLYTDGLTDARAPDRMLSDADLEALVREAGARRGDELARFLEQSVTEGQDPRDDIALLVMDVVGREVGPDEDAAETEPQSERRVKTGIAPTGG